MDVSLRYSVQSEIGTRPNNEDAAFAGPRLLALADGMGGHAAGEVAASLVIAALVPLNSQPVGDPIVALREAAAASNAAIAHHVIEHPEHEGMGATLTAILFAGDEIGVVHVGDSRAYLIRNGSLTQLTKDDTLVQHLIDQGRLTTEQAWHHPRRSMVHKVLTGQDVEPFVELREAEPHDRYLICSDGLSDFVPEGTIAEVMGLADPQRCVSELIRLALLEGSRDNVTCIVADVAEGDSGYNIALLTGAPGREATLVRN